MTLSPGVAFPDRGLDPLEPAGRPGPVPLFATAPRPLPGPPDQLQPVLGPVQVGGSDAGGSGPPLPRRTAAPPLPPLFPPPLGARAAGGGALLRGPGTHPSGPAGLEDLCLPRLLGGGRAVLPLGRVQGPVRPPHPGPLAAHG